MSLSERRKAAGVKPKGDKYLDEIKDDFSKHGKNKMELIKSSNIMIIGRTRSGKSTIKSLLVDPTVVPTDLTLKSGTKEPQIESFYIEEVGASLNIIDTPGLFERGGKEDKIRDNETIMNTIATCVNMEITSFHVICFCVALTTGITQDDVESIKLFMNFLGNEVSGNACLLVTHCESKNEEQRKTIKKELHDDTFFKEIAPFFKLGIYFSGSINRDNYNNGNECILDEFVTVCDYRKKLIELFTSEEHQPFPISETIISEVKHAKEQAMMALTKLNEEKTKRKNLEANLTDVRRSLQAEQQKSNRLSNTVMENERTIKSLRQKLEAKENTITSLQQKVEEMEKITTTFQSRLQQQEAAFQFYRNTSETQSSIIDQFWRLCTPHQQEQIMKKYPEYKK